MAKRIIPLSMNADNIAGNFSLSITTIGALVNAATHIGTSHSVLSKDAGYTSAGYIPMLENRFNALLRWGSPYTQC
jgi:hypothetical protein